MSENKIAWCETNEVGRILRANRKFCRMFGFAENEAEWHYFSDLYRHRAEWNAFRASSGVCFLARLRNRRGRSFKCSVVKSGVASGGRHVYRCEITKLEALSSSSEGEGSVLEFPENEIRFAAL